MIIIQGILPKDEGEKILDQLKTMNFVDGRLTAGKAAREVKRNLQLDRAGEGASDLETTVTSALRKNPVFQAAVLPKFIMPPMFSRYDNDMEYGYHLDSPYMMDKGVGAVRTDIAVTVFLNDSDSYQGGELAIQSHAGEIALKLDAGDGIAYPAGSHHRVNPVTEGARYAAVTWVQSLVRDPMKRELLYDLSLLRSELEKAEASNVARLRLDGAYNNLVRMWSDL